MYNIAVKSVSSWNTDGSTVYDRYIFCNNFKEVVGALKQSNASYMYGKGSDILDKNDEVIFNTSDFKEIEGINSCGRDIPYTLTRLKSIHSENKDIDY